MTTQNISTSNYFLDRLEIEHKKDWDSKKEFYKGSVRFQNKKFEHFSFEMDEELTKAFINLIKNKLAQSSKKLVKDLENIINNQ